MLKGAGGMVEAGALVASEAVGLEVTGMSGPQTDAATLLARCRRRWRIRGVASSEAGGTRGGEIADAVRFRELVAMGTSRSIGLRGGFMSWSDYVHAVWEAPTVRLGWKSSECCGNRVIVAQDLCV